LNQFALELIEKYPDFDLSLTFYHIDTPLLPSTPPTPTRHVPLSCSLILKRKKEKKRRKNIFLLV
jgi:hypothetical protein